MKRIPIFALLLVFFFSLGAQITITSDDLINAGDSVRLANVPAVPPGFDPGPAGPDQHWDFSTLVKDTSYYLKFVDPANTPYGSYFPGSNIAIQGFLEEIPGESWAYITKNLQVFQVDGVGGSYDIIEDIVAPFDPPQVLFSFPANYLDTLQQSLTLDIKVDSPEPTADSIRLKVVTSLNSHIDAWGEVITPAWTGEVLRYRDVRMTVDSLWVKVLFMWIFLESNTNTTVNYKYLANDAGYPVLQFNSDTAGISYSQVNYLMDAGVGEPALGHFSEFSFEVFPNPASTNVNFRMGNLEGEAIIVIYDAMGRTMEMIGVPGGVSLKQKEISGYPPGMYFALLKSNNNILGQKKFMIR